MDRRIFLFFTVFTVIVAVLCAEAPLEVANARSIRSKVVAAAMSYLGVPYRLGGMDRNGLDCSGLVYRVYADVTGARIPRTAKLMYYYTERIPRSELEPGDLVFFNTTGPLSHVAVYIGDSQIVHAVTHGRETGIVISSLDESYYVRTYYDVGRVIPSGGWIGLFVTVSGNMSFGSTFLSGGEAAIAGGYAAGRVSYSFFGFHPGFEMRLEYDTGGSVFSVPLLASIGLGKKVRIYAGHTFAFSDTTFSAGTAERTLSTGPSFINTFGIDYTLLSGRIFGSRVGLDAGFTWTELVPSGTTTPWPYRDMFAGLELHTGISVQLDF